MRTRHVDGLLIAAILLISTAPLYAQRQQQNVAKLKTDARNAVGIIGGDKAKTQTYCQIVDLGRQMNQAVGEKNQKKARALAQEIVELRNQLPEFVVLENVVKHGLRSRNRFNNPEPQSILSGITGARWLGGRVKARAPTRCRAPEAKRVMTMVSLGV
jgi:hypothetical protein